MVILVEISEENWGVGGLTLKEQKEKYDGKE
jgi:phenylpyruvate tautomerase PptA (4-oxalocrotonate tautomerase family)